MQTRLSIRLTLSTIILFGLIPFASSPAKAQYRRSESADAYCDRLARDYARRYSSSEVLEGAAEGAISGAIFGAIIGNAGRGAAAGAALGAIGSGVRRDRRWDDIYWREYDNCMRRNRDRY